MQREFDPTNLQLKRGPQGLIASFDFLINNSEHVLWTGFSIGANQIGLKFEVIQNRDLTVRSQKVIKIEWVLPGDTPEDLPFRIERSLAPNSQELAILATQLEQLSLVGHKLQGRQRDSREK